MSSTIYEGAIDRGLEGVKACSTALSDVHESGICLRGYRLEDLFQHSSFSETAYLLLKGHLPSSAQLKSWNEALSLQLVLDSDLAWAKLPTKNVHPMAWLRTAISLLSLKMGEGQTSFYQNPSLVEKASLRLIAKTPLLIAFFHRQRQNLHFIPPKKDKSLAWNFLYTLTGVEPSLEDSKILDRALILHAEHGLNCSTFSARVVSSSLSDLYSAIVSAIGALKGPLHGGANEQVMRMLNQIDSESQAKEFVDEALSKKEKIMGFGHRVYKNQDPRALLLKSVSEKITKSKNKEKLFLISQTIEQRVKEKKGLCANVDFYSASVYHCLSIPTDLFTPIFAMSRMPGWLAHIQEQYSGNRIYRPASHYKGEKNKNWPALSDRS